MDKFPFEDLIDFIVKFFKQLLDSFKSLSDFADKYLGSDEEATEA